MKYLWQKSILKTEPEADKKKKHLYNYQFTEQKNKLN